MSAQRLGVTVDCYASGGSYGGSCVSIECGLSSDEEWRCPFALCETRPPEEGMRCHRKIDGACMCLDAQMAALEAARRMLADKIGEVRAEMENAE